MTTNLEGGNVPQEEENDEDYDYDYEYDRICSYPCDICGEEDLEDDEDE